MKISIDDKYLQEEELSHNPVISIGLCNAIELIGVSTNSLFDAGCRNGLFLSEFSKRNPSSIIAGCDYFQWMLDDCDTSIKPFVYRFDLRDQIQNELKYDLVVCTEVAEHIDPDYCSIFITNLRKICGGKLIISWSCHGGENDRINDTHLQHLNPKTKEEYHKLLNEHGFLFEKELTNKLLVEAHKDGNIPWYITESIGVFS